MFCLVCAVANKHLTVVYSSNNHHHDITLCVTMKHTMCVTSGSFTGKGVAQTGERKGVKIKGNLGKIIIIQVTIQLPDKKSVN